MTPRPTARDLTRTIAERRALVLIDIIAEEQMVQARDGISNERFKKLVAAIATEIEQAESEARQDGIRRAIEVVEEFLDTTTPEGTETDWIKRNAAGSRILAALRKELAS